MLCFCLHPIREDYDDRAMFDRTVAAPGGDLLPMDFLDAMNKTLLFEPGTGGWYSGNGYVLLGMVLCALTNASSWDQLDQASARFLLPWFSFEKRQSISPIHPPPKQNVFLSYHLLNASSAVCAARGGAISVRQHGVHGARPLLEAPRRGPPVRL